MEIQRADVFLELLRFYRMEIQRADVFLDIIFPHWGGGGGGSSRSEERICSGKLCMVYMVWENLEQEDDQGDTSGTDPGCFRQEEGRAAVAPTVKGLLLHTFRVNLGSGASGCRAYC
ncbi:hypothetical protein RRG08_053519 [Elysia crispata]|uniref:Uncharacterized protein n=1 Tax=Elysia crispata TaxID=231223 RepID=A0AAE0Y270_9GAST|nr:hypothetical protein RRG08_053519 [Elysia crispata]